MAALVMLFDFDYRWLRGAAWAAIAAPFVHLLVFVGACVRHLDRPLEGVRRERFLPARAVLAMLAALCAYAVLARHGGFFADVASVGLMAPALREAQSLGLAVVWAPTILLAGAHPGRVALHVGLLALVLGAWVTGSQLLAVSGAVSVGGAGAAIIDGALHAGYVLVVSVPVLLVMSGAWLVLQAGDLRR